MRPPKSFYIISALRRDSSQLGYLKQHESEADAIEHAKTVIQTRQTNGEYAISFHVLKVVAIVQPEPIPIKTIRYK